MLDDRRESSFQLTADHISQRPTVYLRPGTQLYANGLSVRFSGFIINARTGITVAHGICPGDKIFIDYRGTQLAIGHCCKTFSCLRHSSGHKITADLALLKLNRDFGPNFPLCMTNTVKYKHGYDERYLSIKIYRETVDGRTDVMIQVSNGEFRFGYIRGSATISCRPKLPTNCRCDPQLDDCPCVKYNQWFFDVLKIYQDGGQNTAMTGPGDSGALVMSRPIPGINYVYVYGIVLGQGTETTEDGICPYTVGSQLNDVITQIQNIERIYEADEIDFTVYTSFH